MATIVSTFTTAQIAGLTTAQIAVLSTADIASLNTSQVSAGLTTAQIQSLNTKQIVALTTAQVATLTTAQVQALETADLQALTTSNIAALTTASVAALTTAQITSLVTKQIVALKTAQVAGLTTAQVQALETADLKVLSSSNIVALSTAQVAALTTAQISALTTAQIAILETADVAALTTSQIVALASSQVAVLKTAQVAGLTTAQVQALETADLKVLSSSHIVALSTAQVAALTTAQIQTLTTIQVEALSSTQIQALTTSQVAFLDLSTPLILDLNNDGVKTRSITEGTTFDVLATGNKINTGWVSSEDGLLVFDRNNDGIINDGSELFGSATVLANKQQATDGFVALAELDSNKDQLLTSADKEWNELKVWVDKNSDGVSAKEELLTLDSLNITKLNLTSEQVTIKDNGNLVGLVSNYQTSDGATHELADVWFVVDDSQVADSVSESGSIIEDDLRTRVTGLAQAISSFDDSQFTEVNSPAKAVSALAGTLQPTGNAAVAAGVIGLVDALRKFETSGNLTANLVKPNDVLQVEIKEQAALLVTPQDSSKGGFLAS